MGPSIIRTTRAAASHLITAQRHARRAADWKRRAKTADTPAKRDACEWHAAQAKRLSDAAMKRHETIHQHLGD